MFSISGSTPAGSFAEKPTVGPVVAAEIAMEFASLSAPGTCPRGIYMTPSPESVMKWYGIFFVHSGPYANAVLRLVLTFMPDFPNSAPVVRFESEVFHPLIDPKTKIWHPRVALSEWKPRIHHISHLLHDLRASFDTSALDSILEGEAVNKQIWSLYHHSHHTFLSMTVKRAISTTSARVLYPSEADEVMAPPASPKTPRAAARHSRQASMSSSLRSKASLESLRGEGEGYVAFKELEEGQREALLRTLKGRS